MLSGNNVAYVLALASFSILTLRLVFVNLLSPVQCHWFGTGLLTVGL